MSYRPEFEGDALVQLNGLPKMAFDALVERVAVLVLEPIFGREGETLAALSLIVPDQTLDPRRFIPALQTTSLAIARGMDAEGPARLTAC